MFARSATAAATALLVTAGSTFAASVTTQHLSSDAEMLALIDQKVFTAEGRIGNNNATHGDWEIGLWDHIPADTVADQDQFAWQRNDPVAFDLTYDAGANSLVFSLADQGLAKIVFSEPLGDFNQLFIRTRASQAGSTFTLNNLFLNGETLGTNLLADGSDSGLDIVRVRGIDFSEGFTLKGSAILNWSPNLVPTGSNLAFQVTGAQVAPTPSAAAAGIIGLVGIFARRRRPGTVV